MGSIDSLYYLLFLFFIEFTSELSFFFFSSGLFGGILV